MRKRGEITVFLSLTLVCILSLFMGLLESARTAGARLYLQMAADSALASVMSHYNRNLWDRYQLLFLEYESEEAIKNSFDYFLDYYLEQKNFYPAKRETTELTGLVKMEENGGEALENEILSYVGYRLPDVAADLTGIAADAAEAAKAGDFRNLFEVCRQTGKETRKLQKKQAAVENALKDLRELREKTVTAAERENRSGFKSNAGKLRRKLEQFPGYVDDYEEELERLSKHRSSLTAGHLSDGETTAEGPETGDGEAGVRPGGETAALASTDISVSSQMEQEQMAYRQVEEAARKQLADYRDIQRELADSKENIDMAVSLLEEAEEYDGGPDEEETEEYEPDWDAIREYVSAIPIPDVRTPNGADQEKAAALDRVEDFFDQELLNFVLPPGTEISAKSVSLHGIPSERAEKAFSSAENPLNRLLINEYIFLYFDSFLSKAEVGIPALTGEADGESAMGSAQGFAGETDGESAMGPARESSGKANGKSAEEPVLRYEQEYLLCGQASDRKNLSETVERLLAVRGAANLCYLLSSQDKKTQADTLAAAVSMGNAPVQIILSFFILTLWAFGEAVSDVRALLAGKKVPLWKTAATWRLSIEQLLALEFLNAGQEGSDAAEAAGPGSDYRDYFRILLFLEDRTTRNFRMMDLIQWNVGKSQKDFSTTDCACAIGIEAAVAQKHVFLLKNEYSGTVAASLSY